MGRKIARGFGTAVCVLLFVVCAFLMIVSLVFGSEGLVSVFGYNLYLCRESSFDGLNSGAAVIVEQCEPYDIVEGNLVLCSLKADDGTDEPILGYTQSITMSDGVYTLVISDSEGNTTTVGESDFIGKAGWSSNVLGGFISFVRSQWGVCVMAVLPCLALIVYSILKRESDEKPIPEVIPQRKNSEPEEKPTSASLGVKADGNAEYSRSSGGRSSKTADSVLFTYGDQGKKSPAAMKPTAPAVQPKPSPAVMKPTESVPAQKKPSPTTMKQEASANKPTVSESAKQGAVPSSVAAKRYLDSATAAQKKPTSQTAPKSVKAASRVSGSTAEIPQLPKKKKSDAFFVQSDVPQLGRISDPRSRAVIDLEDAIASVGERKAPAMTATSKNTDGTVRKSADILASRSRSELITDDDDSRDRNRYDVDDILAGLDHRRKS